MNNRLGFVLLVLAGVTLASCGGGGGEDEGGSSSNSDAKTTVTARNHENSVAGQWFQTVRFYNYDSGQLYEYTGLTRGPGETFSRLLDGRATYNVDVDYGPYGGGPWGWFPDPPWVGPNVSWGSVEFWRIN